MSELLSNSLVITVVGMGLVFGAILLLWALIVLLVRFTDGKQFDKKNKENLRTEVELKQRAASAAVAFALENAARQEPHEFPLPPTAQVSPWQAIMRTKMLNKRGQVR